VLCYLHRTNNGTEAPSDFCRRPKIKQEFQGSVEHKSIQLLRENSKIVPLMSCQKTNLRKTLKYSQSRDLKVIQWILWIYYTDAASCNGSFAAHPARKRCQL